MKRILVSIGVCIGVPLVSLLWYPIIWCVINIHLWIYNIITNKELTFAAIGGASGVMAIGIILWLVTNAIVLAAYFIIWIDMIDWN